MHLTIGITGQYPRPEAIIYGQISLERIGPSTLTSLMAVLGLILQTLITISHLIRRRDISQSCTIILLVLISESHRWVVRRFWCD